MMGYTTHILQVLMLLHSRYVVHAYSDCGTENSCVSIHQFEMTTKVSMNEIDVTWTFNESVSIYGFKPIVYNSDEEVLYESPMLHHSQRSMTISYELDSKNNVCIHAFKNSTHVLTQRCEEVKVADYKAIIGILAGTIFLIPCLIGLSYVIYQDYKKRNDTPYMHIDTEDDTNKSPPVIVTSSAKRDELVLKVTITEANSFKNMKGAENAAYTKDEISHERKNGKVEIAIKTDDKHTSVPLTEEQNKDKPTENVTVINAAENTHL